ncbi:methylated-DNA--[protein]-cysteine S-methyltransferase [Brachybacterium sillae]|uniref:methylated-DNA--[protein]-cysteine S-methyltransferase n=1 Tax=Brachybacterium sillae TaxID=2810536 RepID=UPI00217E9EF0|nr:methylated-DNA--[protein]-cysteine S-methyltransferase [Brachybacterium sillae]
MNAPALAHRNVASPLGELLLVATATGLVRVAFNGEGFAAVLDTVARTLGVEDVGGREGAGAAGQHLETAARQLAEYVAGERCDIEVPLDRSLSRGFRGQVQAQLQTIPYGTTVTYRQLAEAVGRPAAVRAVGTACATNPLPIVMPCHRVVRSDGGLGGYLGGLETKRFLLELEATAAHPA